MGLQFINTNGGQDQKGKRQRPLLYKRGHHIWRKLDVDQGWKCCTCGGLAKVPTENDACDRYEPLADWERDLCPFEGKLV